MAKITPAKLARSLMEVQIQTELKLSDVKVLYTEQSQNYINHIKFLYKPLNTVMSATRVVGTQWNIITVLED